MKKIIEVNIGGVNFSMEDSAYFLLNNYLKRFEQTIIDKEDTKEVMEDVEIRVAEILQKELKYANQVVNEQMIKTVIDHLGDIDAHDEYSQGKEDTANDEQYTEGEKRLFRDTDNKMIAGVCSGLAIYFSIDVTIVRIIFVLIFFLYGSALLAYIIIWIIAPPANSVAKKLQLRGYATTAENIRKFSAQNR